MAENRKDSYVHVQIKPLEAFGHGADISEVEDFLKAFETQVKRERDQQAQEKIERAERKRKATQNIQAMAQKDKLREAELMDQ